MAASSAAPWKPLLLDALRLNTHVRHSSYFQLATVGANGRPSNRTVVFRGFPDGSDRIQIHTDSRCRKIEEIRHCPYGEVCWYFADSWEQFRISGKIEIVDGLNTDPLKLQLREKNWFSSSLKSRTQYLGPGPGLPHLSEEQHGEPLLDQSTGPTAAFCLLLLDPEQVDYLNLKSNKRVMFVSRQNGASNHCWVEEEVNP
ncbi:pyridoxine/pyridoxamine 5'-phosphate oxidase 2 [Aristolochia californica]|uniref:pyridoxine/pyridoxamine 5'-phosphate oxidase 2 n=1 Tax=Aristolochia californica TaxID=171875 RepID=UPI0035DB669F